MSEDQDKFIRKIRQQLDRESEALDGETLSRLRQARARAVAAGDNGHGMVHWLVSGRFGGSAVALASVSALAVAVWLLAVPMIAPQDVPLLAESQVSALDDLELLAASEALEFYEDIDFYYWLETQNAQS